MESLADDPALVTKVGDFIAALKAATYSEGGSAPVVGSPAGVRASGAGPWAPPGGPTALAAKPRPSASEPVGTRSAARLADVAAGGGDGNGPASPREAVV